METCSIKDGSSVASSPISSPNISTLLKIKVLSWSKETGLPASVHVRVCNKSFNLHKTLLCTKSGYFKEREDQLSEIEIPQEFPGGAETFEKIMLFIYGCPTLIHPFNIAGLRCAAQFLEMTEQHSTGNLCERFDLYLNQVVLQNWDDTLVVLKKCQDLLPWSEDLLIVSRCIESLAFTACMEILDPERRREKPVVMLEGLVNQPWEYTTVEKIINQDTWIKDLTDLPFEFFRQVIGSLRRQGMKERYVSPLIVFYASKSVIPEGQSNTDILQRALDLLLTRDKAYRFVPVGFYFACLAHNLKHETVLKLQDQIVSLLHIAHTENFIYPKAGNEHIGFSQELLTMESLFSTYVSTESEGHLTSSPSNMRVGKLWDIYLSRLPYDQEMKTTRFIELIETVPMSFRESHDQLYLAVNAFLQVHTTISQEEKGSICSYLNSQKLSQATSLQLVKNEQMPLRLVVQALFIQQLNTHQAFKDCSDSFRFTNSADFSGSVVPSSRHLTSQQSPCTDDETGPRNRPLCFLMQKDATLDEYESTSFRIHNLEEQLVSLKKSLQSHNNQKKPTCLGKRSASRNKNTFGQVKTACIGSKTASADPFEITRLKVWVKSRTKKDGTPVNTNAAEKIAEEIVNSDNPSHATNEAQDSLSQLLGPDNPGRMRAMGRNMNKTKLACFQVKHKCMAEMQENQLHLQKKVNELQDVIEKIKNRRQSPEVGENSAARSVNKRSQPKCVLLDWAGSDAKVAEGCIISSDPGELVNDCRLGPTDVKVLIDTAIEPEAFLWRHADNMFTIEKVVGHMIAWPAAMCVNLEEDLHQEDIAALGPRPNSVNKCKLLDLSSNDVVVAEGRWQTQEQNALVNGLPLGPAAVKIFVDAALQPETFIWRPTMDVTYLEDCLMSFVAWPVNKVVFENPTNATCHKSPLQTSAARGKSPLEAAASVGKSTASVGKSTAASGKAAASGSQTAAAGYKPSPEISTTKGTKSVATVSKALAEKSTATGSKSPVKKSQLLDSQLPLIRSPRKSVAEVIKANQKCKLMDISGKKQVVAEGRVHSIDPDQTVHHVRLGANTARVWLDIVKIDDAAVWRPSDEIEYMRDSLGSSIAWPMDKLVIY